MATWLDAASTATAPMRCANWRSASGGITSSDCATMYHVGRDFQAGVPITSANADMASGCCAANITRALTAPSTAGDIRR